MNEWIVDLRNPSFRGLDGEEGEHGHEAVVVVERLPLPHAVDHPRWLLVALVVEEVSPVKLNPIH